jgi:hypothetical protein
MTNEYAAGFFDGEGSVYISSGRPLKSGVQYFLCASVNNTHRGIIEQFERRFGGSISRTGETKTKKGVWRLRLYSHEAESFLRLLLPHLILKRKQAIMAIRFQSGFSKLSQERRQAIKLAISAFNQKGPKQS